MKTENNLDTDQIRQLVWRLAFPSMLAQFVSVFYSIVDRMYIGNIPEIGETALAGVGVCGPIVTMVSSAAFWVGVGGAPLLSIRLGQKNLEGARRILANCFLLLTVMAGIITAGAFLMKERLLMWFGASENLFPYANEYLTWILLGTVFALLSVGMNQFIICQGFSRVGMMSVLLGAVLNIILDPVFIFVFHMGVKGAAIATVLSQMASCLYVLKFLLGERPVVPITFGGYEGQIMKRVLTVGLTPFVIIALDNVMIISLNAQIQKYGGPLRGDMLLSCNTILQSFMLIVTMPLGGITSSTQTILGYNYGAKRPDRIRKAEKHILILCLAFNSIMFLISRYFSEYFVMLFTRNPEYIKMTVKAIGIYALMIIPLGLQYMVVDGATGMGLSKIAISLSLFRKAVYFLCIFLIPAVWDIEQIFYAEPVSDFLSPIVSAVVFAAIINRVIEHGASETG
ncbi:MAG: MATE family efflux transporter [Lachnospiraceae bacterium]|nr:MATE family efflux transporter [Lachnospiraceae bacterium]